MNIILVVVVGLIVVVGLWALWWPKPKPPEPRDPFGFL